MASRILYSERKRHWRHSLPSPFTPKCACIYGIVNRDNLKLYVGSGVRPSHRWSEHRSSLELAKHQNRYLQRAFKKNPDAFYIEVFEELPNCTKEQLIAREQFWMDFYKSYLPENGYNICPKADSCQGIKRDLELNQRISNTLKGRKMSPERLEIHRRAMIGKKGRKFTEAQKTEQSRKFTGRKMPEGWAKRISEMHKKNPPVACPVLQFAKDGTFINRFSRIREAEAQFGKRSNISSACNGKRNFAFGFVWKYELGHGKVAPNHA